MATEIQPLPGYRQARIQRSGLVIAEVHHRRLRCGEKDIGDGFWQVTLHFGFMEHPKVAEALADAVEKAGLHIDMKGLTYYVGHETLTAVKSTRIGKIAESIFSYSQRNAVDVESTFCLPPRQVIEIGTQIDV